MEDTLRIKLQVEGDEFHQQMQDAKDEIKGVGNSTKDFSSSLGRISPALSKMASNLKQAFTGIKGGMAGVKDAMSSMKDGASGMAGIASAAKGLVSSLAPALVAVVAIVAAITALKKAWDFLKRAFKAWDPTGYAKTFGTFQREIRKLMTAIGALTSGAVKEIMYVVVGIVRWLRQGIEVLVKIKSWVDGILDSLGGAWEIIVNAVSLLGGVFGVVFKIASDTGKAAAEEVGEVWSEEMSVGLASFDKLNNIGMEEGDAEEREELLKDIEVATAEGESLFDKIAEGLSGILDIFGDVGDWLGDIWKGFTEWIDDIATGIGDLWDGFTDWLGGVANGIEDLWDDFTDWAGEAWANVTKVAGDVWNSITSTVGSLWGKFTDWAGDAWNDVSKVAGNIWDGVTSTIGGLWDGFVSIGTKAWNNIEKTAHSIWNGITSTVGGLWDDFTDWAGEAWANVTKTAGDVWNDVTSEIGKVWDYFTKDAGEAWDNVKSFGGSVMDKLGDLFGPLWNKFGDLATAAVKKFKQVFTDAINAIRSLIDSLISGLKSALDGITSGISSAAGKVGDAVGGVVKGTQEFVENFSNDPGDAVKDAVVNGIETVGNAVTGGRFAEFMGGAAQVMSGDWSGVQNGISEFISDPIGGLKNLFGFAQGGVFQPNQPQLAILGDNTSEPEVAAPYSMIVSAVTTALNNMGVGRMDSPTGTSGTPLDITLEIDGKKLARMTYDNYENERIRRNGSGSY